MNQYMIDDKQPALTPEEKHLYRILLAADQFSIQGIFDTVKAYAARLLPYAHTALQAITPTLPI
jgi:hypothetical protein